MCANRIRANGEGTIYYRQKEKKWEGQYYLPNGKRKTERQRKNETLPDFRKRFNELKSNADKGIYIEKSKESITSLIRHDIEQKHIDGKTSQASYKRELETLKQLEKTCKNFCNIPIQKVTIYHIEHSKIELKKYSNGVIDKIWRMLNRAFIMAISPSRKIITCNIMEDDTLEKPISNKPTKKVTALSRTELQKLNNVLDFEERYHKYRNIVKMQSISGMRISEVLARSINDYNYKTKKFNIHTTLTENEKAKPIFSTHTKTYNKKTQIDEGQRYLPLDNYIFNGIIELINEQRLKKIDNPYNLLFWDYKKNTFIDKKEINSWLKRINEKYHITKDVLSSHRLRHTALTYWKEIGLDMAVIQYLAGHVEGSSITNKVYVETRINFVKDELEKTSKKISQN